MKEIPDYLDGVFNFEHFGAFLPVFSKSLEEYFMRNNTTRLVLRFQSILTTGIYKNPSILSRVYNFLAFWGLSINKLFKRVILLP